MTRGPLPDLDIGFVVVGGYTQEQGGTARGISVFSLTEVGSDEPVFSRVGCWPQKSPSYLVAHPSQPWIFAASEAEAASVSSLRLETDGTLTELSTVRTGGDGACHLALSPGSRQLVAANYGSGSVSSFLVGPDGALTECRDLVPFDGTGPDQERQAGPHAHHAVWDREEILVCDLGADLIHRLTLDEHGRFAADEPVRIPAGMGPRHCVVVDDRLVVACELTAELWVARRSASGWDEVQRLPTSTSGSGGRVSPSAVVASGNRVLVANRGPGTIAAFDLSDGVLVPVTEFACGGSSPRDLTVAETMLWVANQTEHVVTVFALSEIPPSVVEVEIEVPSPSCTVIVPRRSAAAGAIA